MAKAITTNLLALDEGVVAGQGDKEHAGDVALVEPGFLFADLPQRLVAAGGAHRDDELPAVLELRQQRWGDLAGGGGDDDGVVGGVLLPAKVAIAAAHPDVAAAEAGQPLAGLDC